MTETLKQAQMPDVKPGMVRKKCQRCGDPMEVRTADVKRGWGKFCSKSCKAIKQTYGRDAFKAER